MKKRILLSFVCFLLCSCASASPSSSNNLYELGLRHTSMPKGIYYDNKIYWETSLETTSTNGKKIGLLQEISQPNYLPSSDFMGTNEMKQYIASELYKDGNILYLNTKADILVFQYIDEQEPKESTENYDGSKSDEYAVPLHFVFHSMTYQSYQGEEIELPDYFKEVGTIKKNEFIAGENLNGNVPEGSTLYATDFQNRFMILKNNDDEKYYLFENTSY